MTLDSMDAILSIVVNLMMIIGAIYSFIKCNTQTTTLRSATHARSFHCLVREECLPVLLVVFLLSSLLLQVVSDMALDKLSVVAISSCVAAVCFMFVVISYKYVLWKTARGFGGVEG